MSSRVLIIDLPSLCHCGDGSKRSPLTVKAMKSLPALRNVEVLCRKKMIAMTYSRIIGDSYPFSFFLQGIRPYHYSEMDRISDLQVKPDMRCGDSDLDEEMYVQFGVMHGRLETVNHQYVSFIGRCDSQIKRIETVKEGDQHDHSVSVITKESDLDEYILKFKPVLNQQKHRNQPYRLEGKSVAPFTLWDEQNPGPAKELLQKAFRDCDYDDSLFPHVLYGWDESNGVWVRFNHNSRRDDDDINREYHGYDLKNEELDEVPIKLREKYHHLSNIKKDWKLR